MDQQALADCFKNKKIKNKNKKNAQIIEHKNFQKTERHLLDRAKSKL